MAVSRALRRLLRVRESEQQQRWEALEAALGELRRIERAQAAARQREQNGRRLIASSVVNGDVTDRLAGLEEVRAGSRRAAALVLRIAQARAEAALRQREFLLKRVERRQAEALIDEIEARDATEAGRRGQQALDNWYLDRLRRSHDEAGAAGHFFLTGRASGMAAEEAEGETGEEV